MMIQEFEKLAGYEVNYNDYVNIIEPMYMAVKLNKADFIQCLNRKRFEVKKKTERQYINEIKKIAEFLYDNCGRSSFWKEKDQIAKLTREMEKQFGYIVFTIDGYEYPEVQRGCTYPRELVFYTQKGSEIKRVQLVDDEY